MTKFEVNVLVSLIDELLSISDQNSVLKVLQRLYDVLTWLVDEHNYRKLSKEDRKNYVMYPSLSITLRSCEYDEE